MIVVLILTTFTLGFSFVNLLANYNAIDDTYEQLKREESQFVLNNELVTTEKIATIKTMYHIDTLEIHASKYITHVNKNIRVVKVPKEVNKLQVVSGRLPQAERDIVLEYTLAQHHKYVLGDRVTIAEEAYNIVGFVEYPNLVAPNIVASAYMAVNSETDLLVSLSDVAYDELAADEQQYYVAIGGDMANIKANSAHYSAQADNQELNKLETQKVMFMTALGIGLVIMLSIIIILLFLVIAKTITASMNEIGVMLSFGYKKGHVLLSLAFAVLTYFLIALVSFIVSELLKQAVFSFFNEQSLVYYEALNTWGRNLMLLLITLCIVFCFVYGYSIYLLRKKTIITLVQASGKNKIGKLSQKILVVTGKNIRGKFVFNDLIVCFLLFFAGFATMVQMLFAFGMMQYTEKLAKTLHVSNGYDYVYSIRDIVEEEKTRLMTGQYQYYFKSKLEVNDRETVDLIMLDTSGDQLIDVGTDVSAVEGVVINQWFANKYGLQQGDVLDVIFEDQPIAIKIADVNEAVFFGKEVYISKDYYRQHISPQIVYNGLYSKHALDDDTLVDVLFEAKKENVLATVEHNITLLKTTACWMIVLGALIGGLIVFISLDVLMRNQRKNMMRLKVLGYTNSQIYALIVSCQLLFVLFGTVIAIPYFGFIASVLFTEMSKTGSIFYDFSVTAGVNTVLIIMINCFFLFNSYAFFMNIVRRKNFGALSDEE